MAHCCCVVYFFMYFFLHFCIVWIISLRYLEQSICSISCSPYYTPVFNSFKASSIRFMLSTPPCLNPSFTMEWSDCSINKNIPNQWRTITCSHLLASFIANGAKLCVSSIEMLHWSTFSFRKKTILQYFFIVQTEKQNYKVNEFSLSIFGSPVIW